MEDISKQENVNTSSVNYSKPNDASTPKSPEEKQENNHVQLHGTLEKKSTFTKLKDRFLGDSPDSVKNYVIDEVLIPSIKNLISSVVTSSINSLLYGQGNGPTGYYGQRQSSVRNYNSAPWEPIGRPQRIDYNKPASSYRSAVQSRQINVDDVIFDTEQAAQNAIIQLQEYIDAYGSVSILRYYDICGVSANFAQNGYGWTTTRDMNVIRFYDTSRGDYRFKISMPPAIPLLDAR